LRPFAEYRDDYRDRSWEAGMDVTVAYQYSPLGAVSLRYRLSHREILDYPLGVDPDTPVLPPDLDLDELSDAQAIGVFTLSATLGSIGDLGNPSRGFVLQPSLELTAPRGFPTNEYFKADLRGSVFQSLGGPFRVGASLRVGRMFPFGASLPDDDAGDGLTEFLQLRDVTLMAGGPVDGRAWGSRLLGPKIPNVRAADPGTGATYDADRYLPLGGLARVSGTLELLFPLPGLPQAVAGFVFTDGARVWTPDARYDLPDPFEESSWFYSTGLGIGVETPVGPIRASLGYKLNPSALDLRDPGDVLALLIGGRPIEEAPTRRSRRFQLHLTVGPVY
jgi:outer membrane protein assembly factor BamA